MTTPDPVALREERLLPEKWCVQHDKPLVDFGTCALTELDGEPCRFEDRWDEGLVEVVAKALYTADNYPVGLTWEQQTDSLRNRFRAMARAVLAALATEAPTESHDGRAGIESSRNPPPLDWWNIPRERDGHRCRLDPDSVPTDQLPLLNLEDGSLDSPLPQSTPAATRRSKASHKMAPAPATNSPDTASDRTAGHIADTSTEPPTGGPHPDTPASRTSTPGQPSADPGTPLHTTDKPDQLSACTCSYYVEKSDSTSHYAVWPPELLVKPIKAMCPESVCRVCGEPRRRIVKSANATDERLALADYLRERRQATGVSVKELATHFPSVSGGMTGCVWNWENAANVPTAEQWPILKGLLALDDRFDVLVTGERAWTESLAEYEPHGDPARQNSEAYAQATMGQNPSAQGMPRGRATKIPKDAGFSDCGHNNYRSGVVLDPFGGSGTTAAVATGHGRDCILVDLDERNYDLALDRVGPLILERGLLPEG